MVFASWELRSVVSLLEVARPLVVGDGVLLPELLESPEAQGARIACAAGLVLRAVARPCEVERCIETQSLPDDLGLGHLDDGRPDDDIRLGARAQLDDAVEGIVERGTAVGVAG